MGQICKLCGTTTIFYYWSTGRNFPRKKLQEVSENIGSDVPICFKCAKEKLNYE